jgi:hypothetical protein
MLSYIILRSEKLSIFTTLNQCCRYKKPLASWNIANVRN